MLFQAFQAHEALVWWQLACVETVRIWTATTLALWDWMEACNG